MLSNFRISNFDEKCALFLMNGLLACRNGRFEKYRMTVISFILSFFSWTPNLNTLHQRFIETIHNVYLISDHVRFVYELYDVSKLQLEISINGRFPTCLMISMNGDIRRYFSCYFKSAAIYSNSPHLSVSREQ